ncbi:MAG: ABC transporter permease [Acidobacteriota bacterium]|nr:ABC transporter permease [Acidobacteriota bacterium]
MKLRPLVARSRGLAAAAVAALALGIGLTALMFAIVDGTVRRGLPSPAAREIVHLGRLAAPGDDARPIFLMSERAALEGQTSLAALMGYRPTEMNIAGDGLTPRRWVSALVSAGTFDVLGARAAIGRAFTSGDVAVEGAAPLVISDTVWREQFGADPSAIGRAVRVNGAPAVVTAVMRPGLRFPVAQQAWMLLDDRATAMPAALWGRLAPGVSAADAAAELTARYAQVRAAAGAPPESAATRVDVAPFTSHVLGSQLVLLLDTLFLAGIAVLVIACANVANLLLARGIARRREFAISSALGASRARLMRDRVMEGLVLAGPGAVLGIALTYAGTSMFNDAIAASSPPYWVSIVVDARVLAYVVAVTVATALVAAALPALQGGRTPPSSALTEETRSTTSGSLRRTTMALVVIEIALSAAVLVGAGLMGKGIVRLSSTTYNFAVDDVVTGRISLPAQSYRTPEDRREFFLTLHTRLQALRTPRAVALGTSLPFRFAETVRFTLDAGDADRTRWPEAHSVLVSPGYFEALGVAAIGGRDFEEADREGRAAVAIVNLSFALTFARRDDLIGRTITIGDEAPLTATVIGIVPDLAVGNARGENPEAIYLPLLQQAVPPGAISVIARASVPSAALARELRDAVAEINPDLPLDSVLTLRAVRETATWFYNVFGMLFLTFGLGALVLALVGVYAVMSFAVTRRRREIGTRMALGATGGDIARMFLLEGSVRLAVGLVAGVLLAAMFAPRLAPFLFQVEPLDPAVFLSATAIVGVVAVSACALPSLRAARQNPTESLRDE